MQFHFLELCNYFEITRKLHFKKWKTKSIEKIQVILSIIMIICFARNFGWFQGVHKYCLITINIYQILWTQSKKYFSPIADQNCIIQFSKFIPTAQISNYNGPFSLSHRIFLGLNTFNYMEKLEKITWISQINNNNYYFKRK